MPLNLCLDLDRQRRAVAHAEPAELRAHAALAGAIALAVSMARRHVEIAPHLRQVIFLNAQQIDPLAAGQLHHRHVVFVRHVRNAPQLVGSRDAAGHLRNDRERSVLLNIGVNAFIDEARIAFIHIFVRPDGIQQRSQSRLAAGIFFASGQHREHRRHRFQFLFVAGADQVGFSQRHARHIVVNRRIFFHFAAARPLDDFVHHALAGSASHAGARCFHHRFGTVRLPALDARHESRLC